MNLTITQYLKIIVFSLCLVFINLTNAQNFIVSGKVYDQNKKPLVGASVLIKGTNSGTSSGTDGKFLLKLQKGNYTIRVSYIGFKTEEKKIAITQDRNLVFQLVLSENILDEILVSAVRAGKNSPITYSNLNKKEIAKRNLGQDIPFLLNYMPSVVSSSDAGAGVGYTYLNVRGSNGERINVTINGIPYNDAESHGTFWVNLGDFASSTESLQLQRGVGTSTNGSGAFGASINILTNAISEKAFGEISNSFGSYATRKHTVKFSTGKINDFVEINGRFSKIYSDGYIDRAYTDLKSYFLQASYTTKSTLIKAITFGGKEKTYQAWFGLTADQLLTNRRQNPYTYENEIDNYQQDHYQFHWNEKVNKHWTTNLGLNYTKGAGYFEQFKAQDAVSKYNGIVEAINGTNKTDLIVRRWLENNFYVINFNLNYQNEKLTSISGISYSNYAGDHFGEVIWAQRFSASANIGDRYYFSDALKNDFTVFSKTTYTIANQLTVYLDLQKRFINYKTNGLTSDRIAIAVNSKFNFFNPKIGLTYKLNSSNSIYASLAIANREPNRNDFKANVNTPESLNDLELGWRLKHKNLKLNTVVYYMNYKNQLVLTGAIDDVGAPVRATSGNSYRLGLEIDLNFKLSEQFSLKSNAAFSKNKNKDFFASINGTLQNLGNTSISFSPNTIIGNTFSYQPIKKLQISLLSKYVGKQFMSNLNSKISKLDVLDSYFTNDFNIIYEIKPKSIFKSIVFTGLLNNIFSVEYVDRGYYYTFDDTWSVAGETRTIDGSGYYPQATRNFLIGLTLKF